MNTTQNVSPDAMFANAAALAAISSPELESITNVVLKAKEEWSGAPMALMMAINAAYTPEQLDKFPIIGSKTGNNPDIVVVKAKAGDKGKEVSFYNVWPDSTPIGKAIGDELKFLSILKDKEKDHSLVPAEIRGMNAHQRSAREKYLTGKRTSIRQAYKNAIKLMHQFQAVNNLDGVVASPIPAAEKGKYENIILVRTTDTERVTLDWEHYNISQFLRLDTAKAEEHEGTFAALIATLARPPKAKGPASEAAPQLIRTIDTFDARLTDMHEFMVKLWDASQGAAYGKFLEHVAKTDSVLLDLADMHSMITDVLAVKGISEKVNALIEARASSELASKKAA